MLTNVQTNNIFYFILETLVPLLNEDTNVKMNEKPTHNDPVIDQVAAELMSELKETDMFLRSPEKHHRYHLREHKNGKIPMQDRQFLVTLKPLYLTKAKANSSIVNDKSTLRIHLARSTRQSLPLPENNAFCYYVPDSPLCHPT